MHQSAASVKCERIEPVPWMPQSVSHCQQLRAFYLFDSDRVIGKRHRRSGDAMHKADYLADATAG